MRGNGVGLDLTSPFSTVAPCEIVNSGPTPFSNFRFARNPSGEGAMNSIRYIVLVWGSNYGCAETPGNSYSLTAAVFQVAPFGSTKQAQAAHSCTASVPSR